MKRYIFLFLLGTLILCGAQLALGLGSHSERLASLPYLLQGAAGLMLGTVVLAIGMLGLTDGYEKVAARLRQLQASKELSEELEIAVGDARALQTYNRLFWKGYMSAGLAVGLFLAGLLGLTVYLSGQSFLFYLVGLAGGTAAFGAVGLLLVWRGLGQVRRSQRSVEQSTRTLEELPDRPAEPQPAERWTVRRRIPARALETRNRAGRPARR